MDDGGNKSEFELEVNDKDTELVSADIESPGDEGDELPTDDKKVVEGDLPAPEKDPFEDELDSELDALEAEEKAEETEEEKPAEEPAEDEKSAEEEPTEEDKAAEAAAAAEASEETTVAADAEAAKDTPADEEKAEEEPVEDKPTEEESTEEEPADEEKPAEDEKPEEEPEEEPEDEPAIDEEPAKEEEAVDEETPEEEKPAEEEKSVEEASAEEEEPADDEIPEEAPIVVDGANAPVDSTQANSAFPVKPAEEKKKGNKTALFVMIAIIIFLLIGIGIFLFIGGGNNGDNKGNNQGGKTGNDDLPPSKVIGLSEFDVKLLQDFQEDKNLVYSPMSIKYAMSVLMEGTDGSTKQELVDVIGNYEPNKYTYSEHLNIANAIFVKDSFKNAIRTSYTDAIKEKYGANTIYDPFNSAATINDWVYTNTLKLIPKIVSDDDLQDAVFVIGNTVAIDMEWVNEIQCEMGNMSKCKDGKMYNVSYANEKYSDYVRSYSDQNRAEMKLNNKDSLALEFGASINNYDIVSKLGESTIRSMVKEAYDKCIAERKSEYECSLVGADTIDEYLDNYVKEIGENYGKVDVSTDFKMYIDDDVKMFAKDFKEYDGAQFQYIGIMPTKANLKDYVNNLTVDKLSSLIGSLKEIKSENFADGKITRIKGVLPEFEFDEKYDLVKEFQDLGVKKAFQDDADLSKMLADGVDEVKVGAIKHAAKIQFTNTGVKAAAATAIVGVGNALDASFEYLFDVPVEEIDMTFDKPFMYLIRDKATEEVWFMGTVYEGTAPKK